MLITAVNSTCNVDVMIAWSCRCWASHTLRSWLCSHQSHLDMLQNKRLSATSGRSCPSMRLARMLLGLVTLMGSSSQVMGSSSHLMGRTSQAKAKGSSSQVMGSTSWGMGSSSQAMGSTSLRMGSSSQAMGSSSQAMGSSSQAMGSTSQAMGSTSWGMGSISLRMRRTSLMLLRGPGWSKSSGCMASMRCVLWIGETKTALSQVSGRRTNHPLLFI